MKLSKNETRLLKALYELRGGFGLFADLKRVVNLADIKIIGRSLARKRFMIIQKDLDDSGKDAFFYCLTVEGYIISSLMKGRKKEMFIKDLKFSLPWYKKTRTKDNPIDKGLVNLARMGLVKIEHKKENPDDRNFQEFISYIN